MRLLVAALLCLALSGCASKFARYDGPQVTQVIVNKSEREMLLLHDRRVLARYAIDLGFAPEGHKEREGDGRTPEGDYLIDRRNPNSRYYLSLGIDYPRPADVARARALGVDPGGDIFIHGQPRLTRNPPPDWTHGCIAVKDSEMREIYAMVANGTPIRINP